MKKLLPLLLVALTGCCQLSRFTDGSAYYRFNGAGYHHPYKATKEAWNQWFLAPARIYGWFGLSSGSADNAIGLAYGTFLWPFSLIDLPCEAACDTAMCMLDWILADPDPTKLPKKETKRRKTKCMILTEKTEWAGTDSISTARSQSMTSGVASTTSANR